MNNKKLTVTIGIPAYNEEQNIGHLLFSLLAQKACSYKLEEIIVIDDASTDQTKTVVASIRDPRVVLITHKTRVGQQVSQNEILERFRSDVIVFFEADTLPHDDHTLEDLVIGYKERSVDDVMVVGNPIPAIPNSLYEKIQVVSYSMKLKLFSHWKEGENVYTATGHASRLLHRDFAKRFRWPVDVPEDAYLYFFLRKHHLTFRRVSNAKVVQRCVTTMQDRTRQLVKFKSGKKALLQHFSLESVVSEYEIPEKNILQSLVNGAIMYRHWMVLYLLDYLLQGIITIRIGSFTRFHKSYSTTKRVVSK